MNPYTIARKANGLTQVRLAALAGVTPQVVTNLEAGLYHKPPASIDALFKIPPNLYTEWVKEQRIANSFYFDAPPYSIQSIKQFRLSITPSFRGFCRLLVFQPSILAEFERYHRNSSLLYKALREAGVEHHHIQRMGVTQ